MKPVIVAVLLTALLCAPSTALRAANPRTLTDTERTAITAYLNACVQWDRKVYGVNWNNPYHRAPRTLCGGYENYKSTGKLVVALDGTKRFVFRWNARPEFPGWQDDCYRWEPDGKEAASQLYCAKCGGWVKPDGRTCQQNHPLPLMDQWRFCVALIAKRTEKPNDYPLRRGGPMEAKAHIWYALQQKWITQAQWQELMGIIDGIEAKQTAAAKAAMLKGATGPTGP